MSLERVASEGEVYICQVREIVVCQQKANYLRENIKLQLSWFIWFKGLICLFIKDVMLMMDYVFGFMSFKIGLPGFTSYPPVILCKNFFFFFFNSRRQGLSWERASGLFLISLCHCGFHRHMHKTPNSSAVSWNHQIWICNNLLDVNDTHYGL